MIVALLVVLVLLIGFIGYTVYTSRSQPSPPAVTPSTKPKPMPKPAPSNSTDDEEATQVRVAGPRLIRTMGGLKVGDEMPIAGVVSMGRGQQATIRFNDQELSSLHAEFRLEGRNSTVTDLGSTNGTFINGEKIESHLPVALKEGDQIKIGTINLVFKQTQ